MRYYLSHSIRGKYGKDATPSQTKANCNGIMKIADVIRCTLPMIELYVPAEHEFPPVGYFIRKGYLTAEQALEIDCEIIDECDGVIVYCPLGDPIQGGRKIEYDHAVATNKPVLIFEASGQAVSWLTKQLLRA